VRSPLNICGTRHAVFVPKFGELQIGCICRPLAWWQENRVRAGEENGYTPAEIEEYRLYIDLYAKLESVRLAKQ
jgi:hypothetical protein